MKRITLKTAAKIMTMAIGFFMTACSDNNNDEPTADATNAVVGNYSGTMKCTVMGTEMSFDDVEVAVNPADNGNVNITIASFGNPPMKLPELVIPNVTVAGSDGKYIFESTSFSGASADGKEYSGTLAGRLDGQLTLNIELHYGNMPMPLICIYTAAKE